MDVMVQLLEGNSLDRLRELPTGSVHCCVTSPPYFGLRDYGCEGQIGLEDTPEAFVARLVEVFAEVRRVLRSDGVLWLNIGDSYANDAKWGGASGGKHAAGLHGATGIGRGRVTTGCKSKDLIGIPWMLAFALRADGWYLRSDCIWHKPNSMPESVTDRPTKAHEYVFLLTKSERYWYDADAVREPSSGRPGGRFGQGGSDVGRLRKDAGRERPQDTGYRNLRSVWPLTTEPFSARDLGIADSDHFATFPEELARRCIVSGCPEGGIVLDPFAGTGTVGVVAAGNGRRAILIELNPAYARIIRARVGLFLEAGEVTLSA